ncbi:MAG: ribosome maturation factor RimP [Acidobacteria bacterium]|nr:MAG: ribosome maturation factor RimP [Acidobacteriota bacterium]RLE31958.1 MAG: ribosome maturation factor RimP [Acidobacteriota bacterium]
MSLNTAITEQLRSLVASEGLGLVSTEMVGSGPQPILRLVVDGPDGVTLDQCAAISHQASALLDVEDPLSHGYTFEVSSPGLDRKLYSEEDFKRFSGHRINVRMAPSFRQHRTVVGELLAFEDGVVSINTDAGDRVELPFDEVFEARLEIDWDQMLKKRKNNR